MNTQTTMTISTKQGSTNAAGNIATHKQFAWCFDGIIPNSWKSALLLVLVLALVACDQQPTTSMTSTTDVPKRNFSAQKLQLGQQVFQKYCQQCHGKSAEGAENWRKLGPDGKFPAPPLNGSGHAWHHSVVVLKGQIYNGSSDAVGGMPAMGDKLSEQEIDAVIAWFQSLWPEKIYNAWYEMQHQ